MAARNSGRSGQSVAVAEDPEPVSKGYSAGRGYLTIEEAAAYLNVSVRFMRRIVCDRRVRHYKVGKFLRFDPADLDGFAEVNEPSAGISADMATEVWRIRSEIDL